MAYCAYLRKSRKDLEAEAYMPGETLARHEQILRDTAKRMGVTISKFYKEIVSGETISARPEMQQLLNDINNGLWEGIFVVEVERLARGDTQDQGIITKALKYSMTKVITPFKTYDPANEFDEEYLEFGLFMSRREYKTITRRMQNGRELSVKQGKYIGNKTPYGYERIKIPNEKGFTLKIIPEEAEVIKIIFDNYVGNNTEPKGAAKIASILNEAGYPAKYAEVWTVSTIISILKNPVYIGKIKWGARKTVSQIVDGKVIKTRPRNEDNAELYDGLHEAIIDDITWEKALTRRKKAKETSARYDRPLQNAFAGLIKCDICGRTMVRKDCKGKIMIMCREPTCNNIGSYYDLVEQSVLNTLNSWVEDYDKDVKNKKLINDINAQITQLKNQIKSLENDKSKLEKQFMQLYNLVEQGAYSIELFKERQQFLNNELDAAETKINEANNKLNELLIKQNNISSFIPKVINVIDVYPQLPDALQKNNVLKSVIEYISYNKTLSGSLAPQNKDKFEITVYPKL